MGVLPRWPGVLVAAALTLGCHRPTTIECLVAHRDYQRCQPSWCSVACGDADAFRWIGAYDKCLQNWEPPAVAEDLKIQGPGAQAACYVESLKAHPGITDGQMARYRAQRPQAPSPVPASSYGERWIETQPGSAGAHRARYIPIQGIASP